MVSVRHPARILFILTVLSAVLSPTAESRTVHASCTPAHPGKGRALTSLASGPSGLLLTTNGYALWSRSNKTGVWSRSTKRAPGPILAVSGQGLIAAAGARGVYFSHDNGATWQGSLCSEDVAAVAMSQDSATIWVGSGQDLVSGEGGGLFTNTDQTLRHWRSVTLPNGDRNINAIVVPRQHPRSLIIGTETGGVVVSRDAGRHLSSRHVGPALPGLPFGQQVTELACSSGGLWAGTRGGGVWRSEDAGVTWRFSGVRGDYVESLQAAGPNVVASVSGSVYLLKPSRLPPRTRGPANFVWSAKGWLRVRALGDRAWTFVRGAGRSLYAWRPRAIRTSTDGLHWKRVTLW
jgi:hypothetical protein